MLGIISHVAQPSPYPTTNEDFDDDNDFVGGWGGGAYVLSFALKISSSVESGAAEEFATHCFLPASKISVFMWILLFFQCLNKWVQIIGLV